jgi:hypothetical protein
LGNPRYIAALQEFGYTPEKLTAERDQVLAVAQADAKQEDSKGVSHASTTKRDAKLDELGKEISKLKALARIALSHEQQTKLGLTGRNTSDGRSATVEAQAATETAAQGAGNTQRTLWECERSDSLTG